MEYEEVHVRIDDSVIASADIGDLVDPIWWTANIYDGPAKYEDSLKSFTRPQRLFHAIQWYQAEVNNGGHEQFYFNSTGLVWRDALAGFELLGLEEFASILRTSAQRLGGDPPLDRASRQKVLEKLDPSFDDLDDQFYKLEQSKSIDSEMLRYARNYPEAFRFDGVVRKPVRSKK